MTAADLEFYQAFLSTFGVAAICATVAWWRARKRAIRAEVAVAELRGALRAAPQQAGLQSAVEAIAIEVERIGEGQRFLTRTLGESATGAAASLPAPDQNATPRRSPL